MHDNWVLALRTCLSLGVVRCASENRDISSVMSEMKLVIILCFLFLSEFVTTPLLTHI